MNHSDVTHSYRTIQCNGCNNTFHVPLSCGDRFCDICSGPRRRKVRAKLNAIVESLKFRNRYGIKFITLTIPNQEDIRYGFKIITKSFRRLRQRAFWNWKVDGGAWVVEVTGSPGKWHVHLHVVCDSKFIRHSLLKRHWAAVSPGNIVYIQAIPVKAVVGYLTKYVSKSEADHSRRIQISNALKGSRLFQPFGSWQEIALSVPKIDYCCPECGGTQFHLYIETDPGCRLSSRSPPDKWACWEPGSRLSA